MGQHALTRNAALLVLGLTVILASGCLEQEGESGASPGSPASSPVPPSTDSNRSIRPPEDFSPQHFLPSALAPENPWVISFDDSQPEPGIPLLGAYHIEAEEWTVQSVGIRVGTIGDSYGVADETTWFFVGNANVPTGGPQGVTGWTIFAQFEGGQWAVEEAPDRWAGRKIAGIASHDGAPYVLVENLEVLEVWSRVAGTWNMEPIPGITSNGFPSIEASPAGLDVIGLDASGNLVFTHRDWSSITFTESQIIQPDSGVRDAGRYVVGRTTGEPVLAWHRFDIDPMGSSSVENLAPYWLRLDGPNAGPMRFDSEDRAVIALTTDSQNAVAVTERADAGLEDLRAFSLKTSGVQRCDLLGDPARLTVLATEHGPVAIYRDRAEGNTWKIEKMVCG